ncbi:MAG: hypothetical protein ABIR96_11910 [Bdellovibrionota bacterium]
MPGVFRRVFALAILFHIAFAAAATFHSPIRDCNKLYGALAHANVDSSVELEIGSNRGTMDLFDTTDGTLAPVLGKADLPDALAKTLHEVYPEVADLKTLPWDALDSESQVALIEHAAKQSGHDFFKDRKVPGLRYREFVDLNFSKPTEFLGNKFPAGKHRFKSADIFHGTAIEFKGPNSMTEKLGFELHVRSPDSPGTTLKNAWSLEEGLGYRPGNLHQHVVAEIPQAKLDANPFLQSTRMAEYYRRINLYAEMKNVLSGSPVTLNRDAEGVSNFGNMQDSNLNSVFKYFSDGARDKLGDDNKIAWVGMRGADAYNGDQRLWGLEFRDLSPSYSREELGRMMDAAQSSMVRDDYGIPEEKIQRWLARKGSATGWTERRKGFFNNPITRPFANNIHASAALKLKYPEEISGRRTLYPSLNPDLRNTLHLSGEEQDLLAQKLQEAHEKNLAVAMLVKNWAEDPLFFENPEVVARIHTVQAQALRRLMSGEKQQDVMKYFLKRSGIHYMFEKSLGIETTPKIFK